MTLLKACPLCGNKRFSPIMQCKDHTASKEMFNIVSCETCSFTMTNPRPNSEELAKYYDSEMYISHTNSSKGIFNWTYQKIRNYAITQKIALLKKETAKGSHLDIGCGTGEFLNACKKAGFKAKGVEPSEKARNKAIANYGLPISKDPSLLQYKDSEFDSISMWHSLEHITELNDTILQINRILKPNGKLIIAVPNHKSWDAKYYKENWAAWDVPIHFWHFSKETITLLLKKQNLQHRRTKPMIFDSFYVSLLSEEFSSGKKNLLKAVVIGIVSNLFGALTSRGYSSMIYIFKKKHPF